jgi:hypothetical protein
VLDLRERFPERETRQRMEGTWRERALEYEEKLKDLRELRDGDQIGEY